MRCIKRFFKAFFMAFGMFCAVPLPFHVWDDACMNLVIPCFPLIGVLLGGLFWGIARLLVLGGIHTVLMAAILTVTPFLLTGFLHVDGFMDTSDAVLSRRPMEDKLRILKDPHTGAFAVIALAVLIVLQFAAVYVICDEKKNFTLLLFINVMSRCCSAAAFLCLRALPQSGYAAMFRQNTHVRHKLFVIAIALSTTALAYYFTGPAGLAVMASTFLGFSCAMAYAYRDLQGVSGDVTGSSLVLGELCGLIALAVV